MGLTSSSAGATAALSVSVTAATTVVSAEDSAITVAKATAVSASVSTGIPGLSVKSTSGEIPRKHLNLWICTCQFW